jgi:hypothetical protein
MRSPSLAAIALMLAALSGCTCGKSGPPTSELLKSLPRADVSRPSALVPLSVVEDSPHALVVATADARGAWEAFLQTAPGRALFEGGALEHLSLSAQVERVLSLGHDLASASEHPLAANRLADTFAGPAAFAIMGGEYEDADFLLVKEVDGSQEFVVRLALMAASLRGDNVHTEQYQGHPLHRLEHGGRIAFVPVFQNVLIVSTRDDVAQGAISLALGKGRQSVESAVAGFKEQAGRLQGNRLAALVSLEADGPTAVVLGLSRLALGLDLDSGRMELGGELSSSPGAVAAFRALAYVPKDAVLFSSQGAARASALLSRVGRLGGVDARAARRALVLPPDLEGALSDEAFHAVLGVTGTRFNHLVGLGLRDAAAAAKAFPLLARNWLDEPQPRALAPGVSTFCNTAEGLCLALTGDYLLAATDLASLTAAVETGLGNRPALSDVKGFQQVGKGGDARFLTAYLDTSRAAESLLTFFRAVGREHSQGFDPGDVEATVAPLCEAFKKLPPYGGGLSLVGSAVAGHFQPLPVK